MRIIVNRYSLRILLLMLALAVIPVVMAGKLSVKSASPSEGEQGTTSLDVAISGSGFDASAEVIYVVAGSDPDVADPNTGGVVVEGVQYIRSSKLKINIKIPDDATVDDYDIYVTLTSSSGSRRGKGTTLFKVLEKIVSSGEDIALDCRLGDSPGDTVLSDGMGLYKNSVAKVRCDTGGLVQPNPSGLTLNTVDQGAVKKAIRKLDFNFDRTSCVDGAAVNAVDGGCDLIPQELFRPADPEEKDPADDMEDAFLSLRPYPDQENIQQLLPDSFWEMPLGIGMKGYSDRFLIQLMGEDIPEEFPQGSWCDLSVSSHANSQDVTVYIWPDSIVKGIPDGYTVTTGTLDTITTPPTVAIPGTRTAVICSDGGTRTRCGGPGGSDLCNKLGEVQVQFTWHAQNQ